MVSDRGRWLLDATPANRRKLLRKLATAEQKRLRSAWRYWARPEQLPPPDDWRLWLVCAGRGFGKTRTGAEWVGMVARADDNARIALVGSSIGEVRSVMVEGESGILACSPRGKRPRFEASLRRLVWPGGAQATLYSAGEPESLRGPQHSHAWCDEVGKWDNASSRAINAWDNLLMGLRLGNLPRVLATTTPRAVPLMQRLFAEAERDQRVCLTRGTTWQNQANLPRRFIEGMRDQFGNTTLGRQELEGELLTDVDGALWNRSLLESCRIALPDDEPVRTVIGVDPPASARGDECGIVVCALTPDGRGLVLDDCSIAGASPEGWARAVAAAMDRWKADRVVAELDTRLAPGLVVRVPRRSGLWRIEEWEWRENGVELQLLRLPHGAGRQQAADAGQIIAPADMPATPTTLLAVELPWDGQGSAAQRQVVAAASSSSSGWTGATLYAEQTEGLEPIGAAGRDRAIVGQLATPLLAGSGIRFATQMTCEVDLASADFVLTGASREAVLKGSNRAAVGMELLQFLDAERIGERRWRLRGFLRGRGGTEAAAMSQHPAGTPFVLLPANVSYLDPATLGESISLAALGLADPAPVACNIIDAGRTVRPLMPVHPRFAVQPDGSFELRWVRRARAGWVWRDQVDLPLNEEAERYMVGLGNVLLPSLQWSVNEPRLSIDAAMAATLLADHAGKSIWVRQIGSHSASYPLLLHTLP